MVKYLCINICSLKYINISLNIMIKKLTDEQIIQYCKLRYKSEVKVNYLGYSERDKNKFVSDFNDHIIDANSVSFNTFNIEVWKYHADVMIAFNIPPTLKDYRTIMLTEILN